MHVCVCRFVGGCFRMYPHSLHMLQRKHGDEIQGEQGTKMSEGSCYDNNKYVVCTVYIFHIPELVIVHIILQKLTSLHFY